MEMNSSNPEKFFVDLKLLPPINPHASPTSHSQVNSRKPKTRALGKVVKPSAKQGLKLVEYDGRPTKANQAYNIQAQNLMVEEDAFLCPRECREFTSNGVMGGRGNIAFQNESTDGASKKGLAKSNLFEICAANYWKPPLFECCKEEGPSHAKMFTFKVIVVMEEASTTVLVCFGAPQLKKKTAAEQAAEGALWYLKHIGYSPKDA
ncbi:hypothetical protein F2P56_016720 [Juglans regia]|uniref:DRBM domain-containing protein n=2 Tax=Juglans regia TaxID=51240 RepID=A0A833XJ20_JUGRE|nr:ribonuclease 3-like protein 1 isoform X2 [Juglans regia]KAF5466830.1 hypothetical protein F2P56_016720 [Juglans regia]